MSNVKLTKFPVTAPDGTEYRVTIRECDEDVGFGRYVNVRIYVKRKRIGYRRVYRTDFFHGDGVYYVNAPNFIHIAAEAVRKYYDDLEERINLRERIGKQEQTRASELRKFAEWDGRITQ